MVTVINPAMIGPISWYLSCFVMMLQVLSLCTLSEGMMKYPLFRIFIVALINWAS